MSDPQVLPPTTTPPNPAGHPPSEEFLGHLAERLGLRSHGLFLVAGPPLPEDALNGCARVPAPWLRRRALTAAVSLPFPLYLPDLSRSVRIDQ
ncbi:hypothetical protein ACFYO0_38750 [Streptomyces sp. NPDC006365]|uniref:hypothetical protein n=1 Tax=Streptomyces sp. NPDC006365 TaxID=3364744 RepID=UPI0036A581C5